MMTHPHSENDDAPRIRFRIWMLPFVQREAAFRRRISILAFANKVFSIEGVLLGESTTWMYALLRRAN
jgi:hypothetical protein